MPGGKGNIKGAIDGRPFKKGGDPRINMKGRPQGKSLTTILKDVMEQKSPKAILDLQYIKKLSNKKDLTNSEALSLRLITSALVEGDIHAMKEIFDRLEGKAKQALDVTSDGEKINSPVLNKNQIDRLIDKL